jgi:hypothetical protein
MKTFVEIRLLEKWANQQYGSSLGQPISIDGERPFVRRVVLEATDPRLADLKARLERDEQKPAVLVQREYTPMELASAELFQLIITDGFADDCCGEDWGTEYDDSNACPICGAGRTQLSPLKLDLSLAPVGLDIVRTIALNECVVSERLVEVMQRCGITGYQVQPVEHEGIDEPKGRWFQLIVTGKVGHTVEPTHFGISYFDEDTQGTYVCQEHMLSGLHILSEAFIKRQNIENVDMALTSNRTGIRSGVLMPTPLILVSPRFYQLVGENNILGCKVEIARIVD